MTEPNGQPADGGDIRHEVIVEAGGRTIIVRSTTGLAAAKRTAMQVWRDTAGATPNPPPAPMGFSNIGATLERGDPYWPPDRAYGDLDPRIQPT